MLRILAVKTVLLLVVICGLTDAQQKCESRANCGDCISIDSCVWCLDTKDDVKDTPKCFTKGSIEAETCRNQEDPSSSISYVENVDLNPDSKDEEIILIKPQEVDLSLRPSSAQSSKPLVLEFEVAQSKEYPVDLYFLLDLSFSMEESRNNFAEQGGEIIEGIKDQTRNLRIGFGSFVDKNIPPFASAIPSFNCPVDNPNCLPPYSFYHFQSLSDLPADEFRSKVLRAPLAGNVDEPEGGLDGLMQVLVCGNRIGWREKSRKLILLKPLP